MAPPSSVHLNPIIGREIPERMSVQRKISPTTKKGLDHGRRWEHKSTPLERYLDSADSKQRPMVVEGNVLGRDGKATKRCARGTIS
jgi:hypothetical protein